MGKLSTLLLLLPLLVACNNRTDSTETQAESPATYNTAGDDWPSYFGDPGGTHYSRLGQITRDNISELREAWRYETPDPGDVQTTPLVIDGTMYVVSPMQKVIALDAATGEEKWVFDSGIGVGAAVRSVTWWREGDESRLFSAVSHYIYAINPANGTTITSFGNNGRIDLRENLRGDPENESYHATSPAVIYKDMLILGGRVTEATPSSPGDQRAYDVRSGELRWTFHTIPMAGEPGAETWPEGARETQGGNNAWGGTSVDTERGIVFIGTGSPSDDFYGGERPGDNLYGDCLIALDANTGEKLWHFQAVHHDVWDTDFPAPPTLLTVTRDGKRIPAVAAANKAGYIYIFDRVSGEPLFPIVEEKVPTTSTVPGEV
ncbi:MAG: PQQ-binding-like beta-propeller repeat protein, partial [Gammaproteobacteria bacterium]|nr:PQQ-binding-like beta-propeller repeat protein [Gammaproteobacteria bacterium]